jgi:hypothetical protein
MPTKTLLLEAQKTKSSSTRKKQPSPAASRVKESEKI